MSTSDGHVHHAIDYIELSVSDIDAAKRFYGAAFGWTFQDYGPGYCGFTDPERGREAGGLSLAPEVPAGGPLVILYSTDLEASEKAVRKAGGVIAAPIYTFPGGRRFELTDPAGNLLAVWSKT